MGTMARLAGPPSPVFGDLLPVPLSGELLLDLLVVHVEGGEQVLMGVGIGVGAVAFVGGVMGGVPPVVIPLPSLVVPPVVGSLVALPFLGESLCFPMFPSSVGFLNTGKACPPVPPLPVGVFLLLGPSEGSTPSMEGCLVPAPSFSFEDVAPPPPHTIPGDDS